MGCQRWERSVLDIYQIVRRLFEEDCFLLPKKLQNINYDSILITSCLGYSNVIHAIMHNIIRIVCISKFEFHYLLAFVRYEELLKTFIYILRNSNLQDPFFFLISRELK